MEINSTLGKFIAQLNINEKMMGAFFASVGSGENILNQIATSESLYLDDEWILTITKYLHSLEQVCKNPRRFIIDEQEVVVVEKAKKIGSATVRHLASHTMNIRGIEDDGTVIPSKVLTTNMAEDLAIYENRFVVTLINRLTYFIEQKYQNIEKNVNSKDVVKLRFRNDCTFGKGEFAFDLGVSVRGDSRNKIMLKRNAELLKEVEILRRRVNILRATEFYKSVGKTKPVLPPIQKTNLILNDKDYSNCYKLYLFLSGYTQTGYSVEVVEKQLPVDTDYFDDLTMLCTMSFLTMLKNNVLKSSDYNKKEFGDKTIKQFKSNKNLKAPELTGADSKDKDFEINQYFFEKVRKLLSGWQEESQNEKGEIDFKKLKKNFPPMFKKFYKLNDGIFYDYLRQDQPMDVMVKMTPIQKKQQDYKRQKDKLMRKRLLNSLKEKELALALKDEARETVKLEKMKAELDKIRAKKVDQKQRDDLKRRRLANIERKRSAPQLEALTYADLLRQREEQKRLERMALINEKREEFLKVKAAQKAERKKKQTNSANTKSPEPKTKQEKVAASASTKKKAATSTKKPTASTKKPAATSTKKPTATSTKKTAASTKKTTASTKKPTATSTKKTTQSE